MCSSDLSNPSGGLPADGFEIPPEILKISTVIPVVGLFLAKQALDDTQSFQKGVIRADQVKVVLETRFSPRAETTTPATDADSQALSRPDAAELFARHFGFVVSPVNGSAPLPGTISWLGTAVRELQADTTDLVIAGSIDAAHSVLSWTKDRAASGAAEMRLQEGIGMVALRRLCDATRDGDQVLAVISGIDASSIIFAEQPANPTVDMTAASPAPAPEVSTVSPAPAAGLPEQFARFARLPISDIVIEADGSCQNLPFNHLPEDGSNNASLD